MRTPGPTLSLSLACSLSPLPPLCLTPTSSKATFTCFIAQFINIPLGDVVYAPLATRTLILLVGFITNIIRELAFVDTTITVARTCNLPLEYGCWRVSTYHRRSAFPSIVTRSLSTLSV
ncbi:hypothetical protein OG21DRAFT_1509620 [Imleria badia]|nr:hypothetical protein OG21DRAFT_1509620 [Imleria badia]